MVRRATAQHINHHRHGRKLVALKCMVTWLSRWLLDEPLCGDILFLLWTSLGGRPTKLLPSYSGSNSWLSLARDDGRAKARKSGKLANWHRLEAGGQPNHAHPPTCQGRGRLCHARAPHARCSTPAGDWGGIPATTVAYSGDGLTCACAACLSHLPPYCLLPACPPPALSAPAFLLRTASPALQPATSPGGVAGGICYLVDLLQCT